MKAQSWAIGLEGISRDISANRELQHSITMVEERVCDPIIWRHRLPGGNAGRQCGPLRDGPTLAHQMYPLGMDGRSQTKALIQSSACIKKN